MGHITAALLNLHGPVIYGVVAALVFAEAALFVGFVFPGETAVVVAGVLASQHRVSLPVLLGVIAVAAVVGDSVGYEVGRRFGDRLLELKLVAGHRAKIEHAHGLLRRRGALAVFIGRFTAVLRALMPALAGSARMPYGRFLVFNALGGISWGVGFAVGGFLVGTAFEQVAQWAGRLLAIAVGAVAVAALLVWSIRRRRREKAELGDPAPESGRSGEPEPAAALTGDAGEDRASQNGSALDGVPTTSEVLPAGEVAATSDASVPGERGGDDRRAANGPPSGEPSEVSGRGA